jgi:hypothetical protein
MGFDHIFLLLEELPTSKKDLTEVPFVQESDDAVRAKIIEAHRILIDLNDKNRDEFKGLVEVLECNG